MRIISSQHCTLPNHTAAIAIANAVSCGDYVTSLCDSGVEQDEGYKRVEEEMA